MIPEVLAIRLDGALDHAVNRELLDKKKIESADREEAFKELNRFANEREEPIYKEAAAFGRVGLDWRQHVGIDPDLFRPTEIAVSRGNPRKSRETLGWEAQYKMEQVVTLMVEDELRQLEGHGD